MNDSSSTNYKLEFLVSANSWEDVVKIFADSLDIHEKRQDTNNRKIDGFFIVSLDLQKEKLTDDFYNKVKQSDALSIINDTASQERIELVFKDVYIVESQLRKLLLLSSDLVEKFYTIFEENSKYNKKQAKQHKLITGGKLNPLTSYLTLGELISILEFDLSLSESPLTGKELLALLEKSDSYDKLKKTIKEKMKTLTIWSVITEKVLEKKIPWTHIAGELKELKEFRDKAAHFQIITPAEAESLKHKAKHILSLITKQRQLTDAERKEIAAIFNNYAKQFEMLSNIADNQLKELQKSITAVAEAQQIKLIRSISDINPGTSYLSSILKNLEKNKMD